MIRKSENQECTKIEVLYCKKEKIKEKNLQITAIRIEDMTKRREKLRREQKLKKSETIITTIEYISTMSGIRNPQPMMMRGWYRI